MRIILALLCAGGLFSPAFADTPPRCADGLLFDHSPMARDAKIASAFWQAATVQTITRCFATTWSVTGGPDGMTPLHYAAENNAAPALIKAIIDAGVDVDARAAGWTPLYFAVQQEGESPETIGALIAAGADVNAPNLGEYEPGEWKPNTPLELARAWSSESGVIPVLLAAGAK
jgi:hypothetical protein